MLFKGPARRKLKDTIMEACEKYKDAYANSCRPFIAKYGSLCFDEVYDDDAAEELDPLNQAYYKNVENYVYEQYSADAKIRSAIRETRSNPAVIGKEYAEISTHDPIDAGEIFAIYSYAILKEKADLEECGNISHSQFVTMKHARSLMEYIMSTEK